MTRHVILIGGPKDGMEVTVDDHVATFVIPIPIYCEPESHTFKVRVPWYAPWRWRTVKWELVPCLVSGWRQGFYDRTEDGKFVWRKWQQTGT